MAQPFTDTAEERTEQATSHRREEFRKQGSVAVSRELLSVSILIAVGLSFYVLISTFYTEFTLMAGKFFSIQKLELGKDEFLDLRYDVVKYWAWMAVPVMIVTVVAGLLISIVQVGFYISWDPVAPSFDRINPLNGFKRILSSQGAVEAFKALLKLGIVVVVVYYFLRSEAPRVGNYFQLTIPESVTLTLTSIGRLFLTLLFSLLTISLADYAFQRYQLEKKMKMTKQEAKEEFKLREGDPLMKSRIKSIQRKMARRRMMDNVPKADVVVTNPTHIAVALKYDSKTMHAPRVLAKGAGVIAQKIKELARSHRIPCVENKPLARTLYKELDINEYIPKELYKAVAQVLAYVYRLRAVVNG